MSSRIRCQAFRVGAHLLVDNVGQPPFQAPQRFDGGFACGEFPPVVGAAFGVVAQCHDGHDVQRTVDPPVACPREPVADLVAAGGIQGGGAVPGREPAFVSEPRNVPDVAEEPGRAGGADAVHLQQAAAGRRLPAA